MLFIPAPLEGAYLIEPAPKQDERGFFSRLYCEKEFAAQGLESHFVQMNNSLSHHKGTLRGLHYQLPPMAEVKLVRCIKGVIFDLILDIREDSSTFGRSFSAVLSSENRNMMYVPQGFAHGFMTLSEESEVIYLVSQYYSQELERGIRWDDPLFDIQWPETPSVISERDQCHPDFQVSVLR